MKEYKLDGIIIEWLGHACFKIKAGSKVIYTDPFQIKASYEDADIILVSHEHYDHCSIQDVKKLVKDNTIIVTEKDSARKLTGIAKINIIEPGQTIKIDDIKIQAIPAYNPEKPFHPKQNGWLGFIIEYNGKRIYHAGDTDLIPEMQELNVDLALLPVGGTYTMNAEEAAKAVKMIKARAAIPMHYASIVGSLEDAKKFEKLVKEFCNVIILENIQ